MRHFAFHRINHLRRHFGVNGEDLLAIYDTAIAGYQPYAELDYISLSTSKVVWDRIAANPNVERAKHPGTNVDCLKMFGDVYLRKQNRVIDEDVVWLSSLGCYVPTVRYMHNQFQHLIASSSSTKKMIAYGESLADKLKAHIDENKVKL